MAFRSGYSYGPLSYGHASGFQSKPGTCKFPGCSRPRYVENYGLEHDFCGRTHANEYRMKYGSHHTPSWSGAASSTAKKGPMKVFSRLSFPSRKHDTPLATSGEIKFYNRHDPYFEFTNFHRAPISVKGQRWPTTEHYFQAQKFVGTPYEEKIRLLPSAREAFQMSRSPAVSRWQRKDWEAVKDDVMYQALCCKFLQHGDLRRLLLNTGGKRLIEHTSNDSYWGDGGDGSGRNKLGELLMKIRGELGGGSEKPRPGQSASLSRSPVVYDWSSTPRDDSSIQQRTSPPPRPLRRSSSLSNLSRPSEFSSGFSTNHTAASVSPGYHQHPSSGSSNNHTAQSTRSKSFSHSSRSTLVPGSLPVTSHLHTQKPTTSSAVQTSYSTSTSSGTSRGRYPHTQQRPFDIITVNPTKYYPTGTRL